MNSRFYHVTWQVLDLGPGEKADSSSLLRGFRNFFNRTCIDTSRTVIWFSLTQLCFYTTATRPDTMHKIYPSTLATDA